MKCKEFEDQYKKFRKGMGFLEWTIVQYFVRFLQWTKSWNKSYETLSGDPLIFELNNDLMELREQSDHWRLIRRREVVPQPSLLTTKWKLLQSSTAYLTLMWPPSLINRFYFESTVCYWN